LVIDVRELIGPLVLFLVFLLSVSTYEFFSKTVDVNTAADK